MLNFIWAFIIIIGIITSLFTNNIPLMTNSIVENSKESVNICLTLLGNICIWSGLMKIAEDSGIIKYLSVKMKPVLKFLFPEIPENHKSLEYISTNMIANILGLGWAATPAGLMAMKELQTLNKNKEVATKSMCMFMIINMSSIQLINVNILAYRAEFGSKNPSEIIGAGIVATIMSTVVAVAYVKIREKWY